MDPTPKKRRRGVKLTGSQLVDAMDAAISSVGSPELAILQILDHYDIDLDDLRGLLLGFYSSMKHIFGMRFIFRVIVLEKGLNLSFSNVKYGDIAPRVGLTTELAGNDMPIFHIHRARIPTPLFKDITGDVQVIMKQYGEPVRHGNAEARSRFLAPVSAQALGPVRQMLGVHISISYSIVPLLFLIWLFLILQSPSSLAA